VWIEVPMRYSAPPEVVFAMLVDRAYQERKCVALEARQVRITTQPDAETPTVIADRVMPVHGAPDVIRAMVPTGIRVVETLRWAPVTDGSRVAAIRVDFPHHPLTMRGTLSLTPADGGTEATIGAHLRAAVPFVAGRLERMAARLIVQAVTVEHSVGQMWLRGDTAAR
jgi:Protein of unknown function (DUF2505)